ncbi:MAG: FtsW/RodA/SpoVE family cell cycle protein [Cytophagales bacterium]|nr:FtsW/RodA/SpoVE family cell cycle protein [Cytophagales bacterium]
MKAWIERNLKGDPVIWTIVIFLSLISVLVVYSSTESLAYRQMEGNTEYYLFKHIILTAISLLIMWIVHKVNYRYYYKPAKWILILSIPLLILTIQFGENLNEARRWITIPFLYQSFQPSDIARLALFVHIAGVLAKCQKDKRDIKAALVPLLFWCGLVCGLVAFSDLSSAILIFFTCLLLMFIGRVPISYLAMLLLVGLLSGYGSAKLGQRGGTAEQRISSFLNIKPSFQEKQAYIAIATGGIIGKGPGNSYQKNLLPHAYSDFIYAIIIEEYGLIGGILVMVLYMILLYRGTRVLRRSDSVFGGLLSTSLCIAVVAQAIINMGVAVGILPITGLPLPMISMGGTSQIFMGIAMGMVLNVSKRKEQDDI